MGKKTVTLPADHARKINKIENEMDSNKMISLERRINSKHPPQQQAILKNQYDDRNKKLQPITQIKKKTKRTYFDVYQTLRKYYRCNFEYSNYLGNRV